MTSMLNRHISTLFLCLSLLLCGIKPSLAEQLSFSLPKSIDNLRPNRHALINTSAKKQLDLAYHYIDQSNFEAALIEISDLIKRYDNNPIVVSHGLRLAAQLLANQNKLEDAIPLIQKTIDLNSLENSAILELKLLLAKLYIQQEHYSDSLPLLNTWLAQARTGENIAQVYYLQAYAHYQLKQYRASIDSAKKGLSKSPADKTSLLSIQLNSLLELKAYFDAEKILVQLIQLEPEIKNYWTNWINILRLQNKNKAALASTELMIQHHPLTENEMLNYAHLLLDQDFPERAASQLERAIATKQVKPNNKHRYLLSLAWEKAGEPEKAILALATGATSETKDEKSLARLIYLHAHQTNWTSLIELAEANRSLFKDNAQILMQQVQAYYETDQTEKAITLLEQLVSKTKVDKDIKNTAQQWLEFLNIKHKNREYK